MRSILYAYLADANIIIYKLKTNNFKVNIDYKK